jgi:hypothetical protein
VPLVPPAPIDPPVPLAPPPEEALLLALSPVTSGPPLLMPPVPVPPAPVVPVVLLAVVPEPLVPVAAALSSRPHADTDIASATAVAINNLLVIAIPLNQVVDPARAKSTQS